MPSPQPLAGQVPYPPPASFAATTTAPPRPCSRRGRIPKRALRAWNAHTTALFAYECQSFLDNFIAGLGQIGSCNSPHSPPTHEWGSLVLGHSVSIVSIGSHG